MITIKILASVPLHLMDVQVEIVKAFLYNLIRLAEFNSVTLVICQKKKHKMFAERGYLEKLEKAGVKIILLEKIIRNKEGKIWEVDNLKIEQVVGSDYDLVLIYAYSISSAKQMRHAFESFYLKSELEITFNSMLTKYRQCYPLYYLSTKFSIPTIQFIVDWLEPDLDAIYTSKVLKYGVYKQKERKVGFLPIYDAYIFKKRKQTTKVCDFVFGYTITYAGRKYLHESLYNGIKEEPGIVLFARDRYWEENGRDDVVSQGTYFKYIENARFSYIIPANDKKEFSIQRMYECLSRDCIPLIDSRCNLDNVFSDKPEFREFWETNNLIVDLSEITINEKLKELNYNKLIADLEELEIVQKLRSPKTYEKFFKNFTKNVKKQFTFL